MILVLASLVIIVIIGRHQRHHSVRRLTWPLPRRIQWRILSPRTISFLIVHRMQMRRGEKRKSGYYVYWINEFSIKNDSILPYRGEVKWLRSAQMPPSLPGNCCCSFILPHSRILCVCARLHQNWLFPTLATTIMIGSQQNCYLLNLPALSSTVAHYLIGRLI